MKASTRACNDRTFSECSNSIAVSSWEGSTIVSYDLFNTLPIEGLPVPALARITLGPRSRAHEFHVANTERRRQLVDAHDRRIAPSLLEAADVLLAEAGNLGQLLLSQALFLSDPLDVPPDQFAQADSNLGDADAFTGQYRHARTGRAGGGTQGHHRRAGGGAISGVPRRCRDGP